MRSGELAARLGVSDATIRDWTGLYAEFLSMRGRGAQPGAAREFSDADALTLSTVALLRAEGRSHDDIKEQLAEGFRTPELPDLPEADIQEAQRLTRYIPVDTAEEVRSLALKMVQERDAAIERERATQDKLAELERKLGQAEGRLELIPRLETEIAELKKQLEEERNRKRGIFGR